MADEKNKAVEEQSSGDQPAGGPLDMDRNEGQTLNGTIGGTGSDLEGTSERLGGGTEDANGRSDKEQNGRANSQE